MAGIVISRGIVPSLIAVAQVNGIAFPDKNASPAGTFPISIQFNDPTANGLPIWGPSGVGVTVVRRYKPTASVGYYACFWHSQGDGAFSAGNGYWGMHPYPQDGTSGGTSWYWEISTDGKDIVDFSGSLYPAGTPQVVTLDQFYSQGMIVTRAGASDKTMTFYRNLPSTVVGDKIQRNVTTANYGETTAPTNKITIGDSPWATERGTGVHGPIKIFAIALSEADMLSEASDFTQLKTAAGTSNIWWGKKSFASVDDLTCDYGTGRTFAWNGANKGTWVPNI